MYAFLAHCFDCPASQRQLWQDLIDSMWFSKTTIEHTHENDISIYLEYLDTNASTKNVGNFPAL